MLLKQEGYEVTSALGFVEAQERCAEGRFDLLIMGHSIPQKDKQDLIKKFRNGCSAPVLILKRHGEAPIEHAEYEADPDEPVLFF